MNEPPALLVQGITKRYGARTAVAGLDLAVERGEVVGFLGPNGAGKTTTIRMCLDLVRPTAGTARVFGLDVAREGPRALARAGALIESPALLPFLSGRDNLEFFRRARGGVARSRVDAVLATVGLLDRARDTVRTYSLGMRQRLGLAIALLADPDLLVLDEPANGLDPAGIVEMRELLRGLAASGRAVLLSSHVLHEAEEICDRAVIIARGRLVREGRIRDLVGSGQSLEDLFLEVTRQGGPR
jgi:ABC-2 type transport system ATP-binding protein